VADAAILALESERDDCREAARQANESAYELAARCERLRQQIAQLERELTLALAREGETDHAYGDPGRRGQAPASG
jgi:prefoldin subunit 5